MVLGVLTGWLDRGERDTKHLFGHNGTMMTRTISPRQAGNPTEVRSRRGPRDTSGIPACGPHTAVDCDGARRQNST
jgi:hypothetical protein